MRGAWNNWYHVTGSTYGTWLRGDPRGWRARHHREHVDGDYQNPPPKGKYDNEFRYSKQLMKRQRVVLTPEQRIEAVKLMAESLLSDGVEALALCVGAKHWHALARFESLNKNKRSKYTPRELMGRAKGRRARTLSKMSIVNIGGIWAKRCRLKPVNDRSHQVNIVRYVLRHCHKGAAKWFFLSATKPTDLSVGERHLPQ